MVSQETKKKIRRGAVKVYRWLEARAKALERNLDVVGGFGEPRRTTRRRKKKKRKKKRKSRSKTIVIRIEG